jgi:hypothetical protein
VYSWTSWQELSSVVLLMGEPSLLACAFCTHGIMAAVGPVCKGELVSLVFKGEGSRLCIRGEHGALSSRVCQVVELTSA